MGLRKSDSGGYRYDESHELGDDLVLTIGTYKTASGSITTVASVAKRDGYFITHRVHQDYWDRIGLAKFRATAKNIEEHHKEMVRQAGGLDTIMACAKCHHREDLKGE